MVHDQVYWTVTAGKIIAIDAKSLLVLISGAVEFEIEFAGI